MTFEKGGFGPFFLSATCRRLFSKTIAALRYVALLQQKNRQALQNGILGFFQSFLEVFFRGVVTLLEAYALSAAYPPKMQVLARRRNQKNCQATTWKCVVLGTTGTVGIFHLT